MATNTGISSFGDKGISFQFGVENNEITRTVFLNNPEQDLITLLNYLFGTAGTPELAPCFSPFDSFRAFAVSTSADKNHVQGDANTADAATINDFLTRWPVIRGGMDIGITYRPMETSSQGGNEYFPVTDESWDYSAQVMSLIGNNFGQNPQSLRWDDGLGADGKGTPITNLTAIAKIIPKVEFVQRQIYVTSLPDSHLLELIGKVNDGLLQIGRQDTNNFCEWQEGCVLLTGLPTLRRWRFDGSFVAELGIKLAINTYKDKIEDGSTDFVTWNRLYRHDGPDGGLWQKVLVGPNLDPIYPEVNLSQVVGAH